MAFEKLKYEVRGQVAVVTLSDPATMNAASIAMAEELLSVTEKVVEDARALVLTGEGRGFCSGANLNNTGPAASKAGSKFDAGKALDTHYNPLVTALRNLPIPLVTAVNGAAAGIGCSFAIMGDIIVAGESAYFLQAFRRIGLVPDGGSSYLLPRMIGRARAMEMMLLGEKVPAATALEWGLINRCVPDAELMPTALAIAEELANGPKSLALIRQMTWDSLDSHFSEQLALERDVQRGAGRTADFAEGVGAFLAKRKAEFKGA